MKINLAFTPIIKKNYNDKINFTLPSMHNSISNWLLFYLKPTKITKNLFEGEEFRVSIIDKYFCLFIYKTYYLVIKTIKVYIIQQIFILNLKNNYYMTKNF